MKKLLIIAVFAVFSATTAFSASLTPSIGISYNKSGFAGEGNERNFDEAGATKSTTSDYGAFEDDYNSVFVELQMGDILSLGIDYVPGDIASPENHSREGSSTTADTVDPGNSKVQVDFSRMTTIYARANIPFLGGAYVKAGWHEVDVIVNESMNSGNTYADADTNGYTVGIGYNQEIALEGLSIRVEASAMQFDDVSTNNGVAAASGSQSNGGRNEVQVESMWGARGTISLVKSF